MTYQGITVQSWYQEDKTDGNSKVDSGIDLILDQMNRGLLEIGNVINLVETSEIWVIE